MSFAFLSAVTIGVPSLFLALEPNHALVKGKFLTNVFRAALPGGLTDLVIVLGLEAFYLAFGFTTDQLSTMSAILLVTIGLLVLYQVCKPFDWKRRVLMGAMTGSSVIAIVWFGSNFGLSPLDLQTFLVLVVFLGLSYPVMYVLLKVCQFAALLWDKARHLGHRA